MELLSNVFPELIEFNDKLFLKPSKSCAIDPSCYERTSKTQPTDRIFKSTQFMSQ